MLYVLWAILNIGLFLLFIVTCFKASKVLREKFGMLTAIFFVFGLLSFVSNSATDNDNLEPNSKQTKTWSFVPEDSLNVLRTFLVGKDLEKTPISKYNLGIKFGKDKQNKDIPISAYSTLTGFVTGTSWRPLNIIVNTTGDEKTVYYSVSGIVKWKLLGTTLYSQPKEYEGIVMVK
jgi:hypothetical protein